MNTSYTNPGGSGDRTTLITVTYSTKLGTAVGGTGNLINGLLYPPETYNWAQQGVFSNSGEWCCFDFGVGESKIIDECKWYQSDDASHGTWKWQGSDNGSEWTDIGSSFTLGTPAIQTQTSLGGNVTGYRYYRLLGISGNVNNGTYVSEAEFKIDDYVLPAAFGESVFIPGIERSTFSKLSRVICKGKDRFIHLPNRT